MALRQTTGPSARSAPAPAASWRSTTASRTEAVLPHLARGESGLRAGDFGPFQAAIDLLTDALLSHLAYEEWEIVEPLARHGLFPGQIDGSGRARRARV